MKQKKPIPEKKDTSLSKMMQASVASLVILALFFILPGKDKTPKVVPEKNQASVCSEENFPVCGKDGKTYTNSCTAEKIADVRIAYVGPCRSEESPIASEQPESPDVFSVSGSEVDSGIENLESVPRYLSDRENTGSTILSDTGASQMVSWMAESASGQVDPTLITYSNGSYHYGFSMPKSSYYQAFGAQNGASHSVGISTGTGMESLLGSEVRVYFYANTIAGKLSEVENGFYTDSVTGTVYILLGSRDSVIIESDDPKSELVQTIIRTIHKE